MEVRVINLVSKGHFYGYLMSGICPSLTFKRFSQQGFGKKHIVAYLQM